MFPKDVNLQLHARNMQAKALTCQGEKRKNVQKYRTIKNRCAMSRKAANERHCQKAFHRSFNITASEEKITFLLNRVYDKTYA